MSRRLRRRITKNVSMNDGSVTTGWEKCGRLFTVCFEHFVSSFVFFLIFAQSVRDYFYLGKVFILTSENFTRFMCRSVVFMWRN